MSSSAIGSSMIAVGKSNFVSSATGLVQEGVPLSRLHEIKTPKVERVLLRQNHQMREFVTGTLCLTDRHLIFVEPSGAQETWVLYHHISSVERQALTTKGYPLVISCKTFQQLHLIIPRESDCLDTMETIHLFARPEKYGDLYAFQYQPNSDTVKQSSGWHLYDPQPEYSRMGVPNASWQATTLNENFELCETYTRYLYVPAAADSSTIQGSAKFRSKGRLPILCYYYQPTSSALCRSSQPLAGLLNRSAEDEEMIRYILQANPNSDTLYLLDTRPRINAMANRAAGKGYESAGYYPNVSYQFYNIQNIHVMRESLQKMMEGLYSPHLSMTGFLSSLEASGWLRHIQLIMEAAVFSSKAIQEGSSVLVHCSDGWDRTAQTCALTSLFLDPYYRNLHGFMILIEKEWLSVGHKFTQRCGHTVVEEKETSPIFTQFLECVWQVMVQWPTAFQFNEHFLITLHDHAHSCQFGTFLGNCEKERLDQRFSEQTYSLWGHIWNHLDDYINPLFRHGNHSIIEPNTDIRQLKFWRGLYGRYCLRDRFMEKEEELMSSLQQQNACLEEHIKFLVQTKNKLEKVLVGVRTTATQSTTHPPTDSAHPPTDSTHPHTDSAHLPTDSAYPPTDSAHLSTDSAHPPTNSAHSSNSSETHLSEVVLEEKGKERCSMDGGEEEEEEGGGIDVKEMEGGVGLKEVEEGVNARKKDDDRTLIATNSSPLINATSDTRDCTEMNAVEDFKTLATPPPQFPSSSSPSSSPAASTLSSSVLELRDLLTHIPEMNLPWQSLRSVQRCSCGRPFTFLVSKYHCSYCGTVSCDACASNHAPLPWHATSHPHRVCRSCHKLMQRRQDLELSQDRSSS